MPKLCFDRILCFVLTWGILTAAQAAMAEPTVQDDSATTNVNTAVEIPVLDNDSGDWVGWSHTQPSNGTVSPVSSGLRYVPNEDFVGLDTFTYSLTDSTGPTLVATVTVTVTDEPAASVADDIAGTYVDTAVFIPVLANDNGVWTDSSFTQPANGTVSAEGSLLRYTPNSGFIGIDTFTYTVTPNGGSDLTATVTVKVVPPLVVRDDLAAAEFETSVVVAVLNNDSGDFVDATFNQGANGSVVANGAGVIYTPNPGFLGIDSFTYTMTDSIGITASATVTIAVNSTDSKQATLPLFTCGPSDEICNQTQGSGLAGARGYGRGMALVDVNGDGLDDLFIVDSDDRHDAINFGRSRFHLNNGDGTFQPAHQGGLQDDDIFAVWGASFADYDNDGDPDLLLINGGYSGISTLALYENKVNETGNFVRVTDSMGIGVANDPTEPSSWWGASWSDYDNDGWNDVIITRIKGTPLLFHNDQGQGFTEVASALGINILFRDDDDAKNPVWWDYDGDGDDDLYIAGFLAHALYENVGGTQFLDVTSQVFTQPLPNLGTVPAGAPAVFAAGTADFNQDGRDDLYLGRWTEQDLVLLNQGAGQFQILGLEIGLDALHTTRTDLSQPYENTMGLGIGDLFDDGFPDVFIGTGDPERADKDILYCNETGIFFRCTERLTATALSPYRTRGHAPVFGDVDNDGDTDLILNLGGHPEWDELVVGRDTPEVPALYLRQPAVPATTATIRLVGTLSNRDAIGARIRIDLTGQSYYSAVRSTQGFQAQNSNAIVLNLDGEASGQVTINWPSGKTTALTVYQGDRLLVVE